MKKTVICLLLVAALLMSGIFALADTFTLEEILPSLTALTDEELASLIENATTEQARRAASVEPEVEEEPVIDATPITERDDYVERTPVQRGDKGDEAKAVQEKLIELGFLVGTADGDFGRKSESAVMLFQKANGLEETGIADSITQYVLYSDTVIDKEAYDNMPIATGDGWEMINEYHYTYSANYDYYICILKNTSGYNAKITVNVVFYDVENNIIGVGSNYEYACESGYETYWSFSNEIPFDHVSTEILVEEDTRYGNGSQSNLELTTSVVGNKVILTAKNTGQKPIEFPEYNIVYFNDMGEIVSTDWGYISDNDSEIKPGATEMRDESYSKGFSNVEVYVHGRIDA